MPEDAKKRIAETLSGRIPWNKGKRGVRKQYIPKGRAKVIERMSMLTKGKFGKEHPKWTEDKKRPLYKAIREIFKYVEWRKTVFTRDNFTCVLCGMTKVYIEADHHPIRFVDILKRNEIESIDQALNCEELWDTKNGRTLCKPCHLNTPTWGRKPRLQEEQ